MELVGLVLIVFLLFKAPDWIWEYRFSKKIKQLKIASEKRIERLAADREKYSKDI